MFPRALLLMTVLVLVAPVWAQKPGIVLQLETTVLEPGESIVAKLVCTNLNDPETPQTVMPDGLKLSLLSATPSVFNQSSWVNGRTSRTVTHTYELQIIADQPGRFLVGPVSVKSGGKIYKTKPVTIVVRKPAVDTGSRGDRFIFAEIEVEPRSLYVTEPFVATLTIGIRNVVIRGQQIDLDLLKIIDARQSQLSVFASHRFTPTSTRLADSKGQTHNYTIYRSTARLRAEKVGTKTIGPIFLKAGYPTEVRRSFFNNRVTRSRRETARADAVGIEVKGPPLANRPPSFQGALGRYTLRVTAKPNRVEQGQPVTLTIAIRGKPLEGVAGPNLAQHPELTSRFEFSRNELLGDLEGMTKTFRLALFPKQQGEQTIPPIRWSYFDPKSEVFVTRTSNPIPLTVDPPSATSTTINLANENESPQNGETLTLLTGGISPNYVDPATVLAGQVFVFSKVWSTALLFPPLFWLGAAIMAWRRERFRADSGLARRRRAVRNAQPMIRSALHGSDATERWANLAAAMTGYLADRFNLPPGTLTPDDARTLLESHTVEPQLAHDLVSFLTAADAARYAPSELDDASVRQATQDVRRWIRQLERIR
ncbi:MAG: BatD family protein [Planctomycetes bacterium]|nr:BatD family protein [Planctomycetota bacterium]